MTDIVLMDGGMGQELVRRSSDPAHPQWGAWVMMNEPEIVQGLHEEYIAAGARAITVNSYSINRRRLEKFGMAERTSELYGISLDIAHRARDASGEDVAIMGCLSPLNGSYNPATLPPDEVLLAEYREVVAEQADRVDLLLCETMSKASEAQMAATAACESGKPVWVAWTMDEELGEDGQPRLRSGETVAEALAALDGLPVQAVTFNCCPPEVITAGIAELVASGHPAGAYANGFTPIPKEFVLGKTVDMVGKRTDLEPPAYAGHMMDWIEKGATLVGGCCETTPAHTAEMARRLEEAGHRAVGMLS